MEFKLTYTERSLKDISKLDRVVKKRISKRLLEFLVDPVRYSEPIKEFKFGKRRFRVGAYRVIFDISGEEIVILRVGHRREIYK